MHIAVLNLIFFHRYFNTVKPITFEVLDMTIPAINDADLETLIESRVNALVSPPSSPTNTSDYTYGFGYGYGYGYGGGGGGTAAAAANGGGGRARIAVEFLQRRRSRSGLWFGAFAGGKAEEEVCWETWTLQVTIATPKTEDGMYHFSAFWFTFHYSFFFFFSLF